MFFEKMRLKLLLEIFHEFFRKCMSNTSTPYSVIQNFSSKTSDSNDKVLTRNDEFHNLAG